MLVYQNNETAAILVYQTSPVGEGHGHGMTCAVLLPHKRLSHNARLRLSPKRLAAIDGMEVKRCETAPELRRVLGCNKIQRFSHSNLSPK